VLALRLVVGGPVLVYVAAFGIFCLVCEILVPYHAYERYLKALTLVLFAYVVAAFSVRIPWAEVLDATFLPRLQWDRDYLLMLVHQRRRLGQVSTMPADDPDAAEWAAPCGRAR
jgi:Mn2+/Fe2+ NRAMP family transporter